MRRSSGSAACRVERERRRAAHVLDLLRGLPEEEIGADRRAEDAHHHRRRGGIEREARPDRAKRHLAPGNMDREQHRGVGEQRKGQPLQVGDIAVVGDEHLQQQRQEHEEQRHQAPIDAGDEFADFSHRRDVGGDVERVGDQQQQHDALQDDRRERRLDVGGEAFSGDPADPRANRLDRRHQRKGQRHGPEHVEAVLRARLGIGGDAARIVVGDAGDQARPDRGPEDAP